MSASDMIFIFGFVAFVGWYVDRGVRHSEGRIISRLDELQRCLAQAVLTATGAKSLGELLEEALDKLEKRSESWRHPAIDADPL